MYDIAIWTQMNAKSGFGHFYRMIGLYEKLLKDKQSVCYFSNDDYIELNRVNILHTKSNDINAIVNFLQKNSIKIVIIDNYNIDKNDLNKLKKIFKIIYFDAKFENPQVDAIINFNPFSKDRYKEKNPNTKYFLGLEHMMYREDLKSVTNVKSCDNEIFISIGGSDISGVTYGLLPYLPVNMKYNIVLGEACSQEYYIQVTEVLESLNLAYGLYQQPKNYFEILARSEFAIISCSTSAYEVIYFKKPFICINVVDNQNILTQYLSSNGIKTLSKDNLEDITSFINKKMFYTLDKSQKDVNNPALFNYIVGLLNEK